MSETDKPSVALANNLVDRLIESGLLRAERRDALAGKIASGTMRVEDWTLEVELAVAKGGVS